MVAELPYLAPLQDYEREAAALFSALEAGDREVEWRFKWERPRFRGDTLEAVQSATLDLADARFVIAREYGFADCPHLLRFLQPTLTFSSGLRSVAGAYWDGSGAS